MIRATVWTVGLFGAGTAICRVFPWPWTEPLVLMALGLAFLFVSARTGLTQRRIRRVSSVTPVPTNGSEHSPLAAPVQVERTA
jgi:hypothetical protein